MTFENHQRLLAWHFGQCRSMHVHEIIFMIKLTHFVFIFTIFFFVMKVLAEMICLSFVYLLFLKCGMSLKKYFVI